MLGELDHRSRRYEDLRAALGGITHKVLTDTLRRADRAGLVARRCRATGSRPPPSTNSPTSPFPRGAPAGARLARAGKRYPAEVVAGAQISVDHPVAGLAEPTDIPLDNPSPPGREVNT